MNTLDLFEHDVLSKLSPYTQISWDDFYSFFPGIKSDPEFSRKFAKTLRKLLEQQLIQSSQSQYIPRYWRLTSCGRNIIETVAV